MTSLPNSLSGNLRLLCAHDPAGRRHPSRQRHQPHRRHFRRRLDSLPRHRRVRRACPSLQSLRRTLPSVAGPRIAPRANLRSPRQCQPRCLPRNLHPAARLPLLPENHHQRRARRRTPLPRNPRPRPRRLRRIIRLCALRLVHRHPCRTAPRPSRARRTCAGRFQPRRPARALSRHLLRRPDPHFARFGKMARRFRAVHFDQSGQISPSHRRVETNRPRLVHPPPRRRQPRAAGGLAVHAPLSLHMAADPRARCASQPALIFSAPRARFREWNFGYFEWPVPFSSSFCLVPSGVAFRRMMWSFPVAIACWILSSTVRDNFREIFITPTSFLLLRCSNLRSIATQVGLWRNVSLRNQSGREPNSERSSRMR